MNRVNSLIWQRGGIQCVIHWTSVIHLMTVLHEFWPQNLIIACFMFKVADAAKFLILLSSKIMNKI